MAGGLNFDDDDGIVDINITPFVDVILVLLVIFMVAATYIVKPSIEVDCRRLAVESPSIRPFRWRSTPNLNYSLTGSPQHMKSWLRPVGNYQKTPSGFNRSRQNVPHGEVVKLI